MVQHLLREKVRLQHQVPELRRKDHFGILRMQRQQVLGEADQEARARTDLSFSDPRLYVTLAFDLEEAQSFEAVHIVLVLPPRGSVIVLALRSDERRVGTE